MPICKLLIACAAVFTAIGTDIMKRNSLLRLNLKQSLTCSGMTHRGWASSPQLCARGACGGCVLPSSGLCLYQAQPRFLFPSGCSWWLLKPWSEPGRGAGAGILRLWSPTPGPLPRRFFKGKHHMCYTIPRHFTWTAEQIFVRVVIVLLINNNGILEMYKIYGSFE